MSTWDDDDWDDLDEWAEAGDPPSRGWVVVVGVLVIVPFVLGVGVRGVGAAGAALLVIVGFLVAVGVAFWLVTRWLGRQGSSRRQGPAEWSDRR